jgi:hypothetical protein
MVNSITHASKKSMLQILKLKFPGTEKAREKAFLSRASPNICALLANIYFRIMKH